MIKIHKLFLVVCLLIAAGNAAFYAAPKSFDETANRINASFSIVQKPRPWDKRKELAIGSNAPDWQLKTVNGETVALSELCGKVVVLDFWAEWCGPCRKMEPLFDQLVCEYQSQPVKFFTVSIWPGQNFNPQDFWKEHKLASTFLIGNDTMANEYGIWGMPTYIVISPTGKISFTHTLLSVDSEALGKRLREAIGQALPKEPVSQSSNSDRARKRDEWQRPPLFSFDPNNVFIINDDDGLVVDACASLAATRELIAALRKPKTEWRN